MRKACSEKNFSWVGNDNALDLRNTNFYLNSLHSISPNNSLHPLQSDQFQFFQKCSVSHFTFMWYPLFWLIPLHISTAGMVEMISPSSRKPTSIAWHQTLHVFILQSLDKLCQIQVTLMTFSIRSNSSHIFKRCHYS